jgi:hypothetical protein
LVADVLLNGKPARLAPPIVLAWKVVHRRHLEYRPALAQESFPYGDRLRSAQTREIPMAATTTTGHHGANPPAAVNANTLGKHSMP